MATTSIQWTDRVWNPVRGCALVSPGCERCYAMKQAHRFSGKGAPYEGLTVLGKHGPRWTGRAREVPEMLAAPLRWRKPCRVFVNSMSDLFHEDVSDEYIDKVFAVMALSQQHTFQVLTKRAERMARYFSSKRPRYTLDWYVDEPTRYWVAKAIGDLVCSHERYGFHVPDQVRTFGKLANFEQAMPWPLPNVWIGVSVEDQQRADERIPHLLRTPAAVRFLSCEPLLEKVLLDNGESSWLSCTSTKQEADDEPCCVSFDDHGSHFHGIDWVIVGGESGPGARRFNASLARSIVKQCRTASVPVFVKQMGANVIDRNDRFNTCRDTSDLEGWPLDDPDAVEENIDGHRTEYQGAPVRIRLRDKKGGDQSEWPPELRVREFPASARP